MFSELRLDLSGSVVLPSWLHEPMSIRDSYNPYGPCPCESGKKARFCCRQSVRTWAKSPARVKTKGPKTGLANDKCYLSNLHDCSAELNREHYISRALLAELEHNNTIKVTGLSWQKPQTFSLVGINSLVSKILCCRHNEALSPLDKEMGRFYRTVKDFKNISDFHEKGEQLSVFNGFDLEKWILKTGLGLISAKKNSTEKMKPESVSLLYGSEDWPAHYGVYFNTIDRVAFTSDDLLLQFFHGPDFLVRAIRANVLGLRLTLLLGRPDHPLSFGEYRPRTIILKRAATMKFIEMFWPDSNLNNYVLLDGHARYEGSNPDLPEWARESEYVFIDE